MHKKNVRAITFETLLHAKKWFFKNIFWKLFLKSARSADLRPELPPIKPEKITFLKSRCFSSRQFIFSLLRVFSKKIIFFKKIFHFFQKCKNGYFEIFLKIIFKNIFSVFSELFIYRYPAVCLSFEKNILKKDFWTHFWENIFKKNLCFYRCFWALKKALFRKNLFFTKITKYAR